MAKEETEKDSQKCSKVLMKELSEQIKGSRRSMLDSLRNKTTLANNCIDDLCATIETSSAKSISDEPAFSIKLSTKKDEIQ